MPGVESLNSPFNNLLSGSCLLNSMTSYDLKTYLPDDILVKLDRASMSCSLETRSPFLDHNVVTSAFSLPSHHRSLNNSSKLILKNILLKYLPKSLFSTPKRGFGIPLARYLRGNLKEWAGSYLNPYSLSKHPYLDSVYIMSLWHEHQKGIRNWSVPLWDILMWLHWNEHN